MLAELREKLGDETFSEVYAEEFSEIDLETDENFPTIESLVNDAVLSDAISKVDNGTDKFVSLVEKANQKIKEKGEDAVSIIPLERSSLTPFPGQPVETAVTEEDRPLTDEEREFMYESDRKSALNGLAYNQDYISDILENIYGELRTRSFNALWRKHVDPLFTGELNVGRGKNFSDYVVTEMIYDGGFCKRCDCR